VACFSRPDLRSFFDHLSPAFHHDFTIKKPSRSSAFPQKTLLKRPSATFKKMSPSPCDNPMKDHRLKRIRIQPAMETPVRPPEQRTSYPSPALVFVIVGVIVAAFVMFLVLGPH